MQTVKNKASEAPVAMAESASDSPLKYLATSLLRAVRADHVAIRRRFLCIILFVLRPRAGQARCEACGDAAQ